MAVILRVVRTDETGTEIKTMEYRAARPPTEEDIKQAKELDEYLTKQMVKIRDDMEEQGLLERRLGSLERWHALGRHLAEFVDNPDIVPASDRAQDRYIWQAIGQHAPAELHPGKDPGQSKNAGTDRDHFRLCYLVATTQEDYEQAERQGTWRDWVLLLESPFILRDKRTLTWLRSKLHRHQDVRLRPLARVLRSWLKDMYTQVLTDEELHELLEGTWQDYCEKQATTEDG